MQILTYIYIINMKFLTIATAIQGTPVVLDPGVPDYYGKGNFEGSPGTVSPEEACSERLPWW